MMRMARRFPAGARATGAAALAYAILATVWTAPSSLSPTETLPDLGDPLHLAWVMAWDAHQVVRAPWALFDSNAFFPYSRSLTFGDHLLPEALLVAPVFWATGNAVLASNVAVLTALILSALAMFVLVRQATGSAEAGFLAGLFYSFNSFTLHERLRVQVLSMEWWPLALLFLVRLARRGRAADAWLFAVFLALQGLSGSYYLIYTALLAPLWLMTVYVGAGRRPSGPEVRRLLLALVVAAAPAGLLLRPYIIQFRRLGFEKSWAGGADLLAYLDPAPGNWLWGRVDVLRNPAEIPHFLGFLGALLAVVGAVRVLLRRPETRGSGLGPVAIVTALIGLVLSLGPIVHVGGVRVGSGPYDLLYRYVPFFRGMASPERIGVLLGLGGAILVGFALAALFRPVPQRLRPALLMVLGVLLPLEHWSPPLPAVAVPTGGQVPSVYRWLARDSREPMVEMPLYPERSKKLWAAYLYFSTYHWRPVPIGRTSFYPPAHDFLAWSLRPFPDETSVTLLSRLGIRTVVVHPHVWEAGERAQRLEALDSHPRLRLVGRFDDVPASHFAGLGLGDERVYRLAPDGDSPVRLCMPSDEVPREGWSFRSTGVNKPERAVDGERRTAWFTARPQRPGDRLEWTLPQPERLSAIAVEMSYPFDEFARNLILVAEGEDAQWRRVPYADGPEERWAILEDLLRRPATARMVLRFVPQVMRSVRLAVGFREEDPAWPRWAVPEVRAYRECRSGHRRRGRGSGVRGALRILGQRSSGPGP